MTPKPRNRWSAVIAVAAFVAVSVAATGPSRGASATSAVPETEQPQDPFLCTTEFNGLGQPIVDNQDRHGTPVYPTDGSGAPDRSQPPLGWSQRCQADTRIEYRYRTAAGQVKTLPDGATSLPSDIAMLPVSDFVGADRMDLDAATDVPYLYRFVRGTLPGERFLYSIAMLVPFDEVTDPSSTPDTSYWNRRLLFSFGGGVGIGHSQGDLSSGDGQRDEALRLGHAVVYSSGTRMSVHYNLDRAARTAAELKALFVDTYGAPLYTVGIGASGGSIQQFHLGQSDPDVLDALIPEYSYPDMTTQTIHVGDCELLEHYMDVTDAANPRWEDWDNREILEGLNSIEGFSSDWATRAGNTGSSECIEGWRGLTPLVLNPTFPAPSDLGEVIGPFVPQLVAKLGAGQPVYPDDFPDLGRVLRTHEDPTQWVEWTHWADVADTYGVDDDGYGRVPWDNVGVQYGLRAVAGGQITPDEFLKLNAEIGTWKSSAEMPPEDCDMIEALGGADLALLGSMIGICSGRNQDWYSSGGMELGLNADGVAPRREGDVTAMQNAYEKGLVFEGSTVRDIPILETRPYLEDELNMHNTQQSFGIRARMRAAQGDDANHVIWFHDARPSFPGATERAFDGHALVVMDEWMTNLAAGAPSAAAARPDEARDSCFATDGSLIASGSDVWDGAAQLVTTGAGAWTGTAPDTVVDPDTGEVVTVGACAKVFPLHSTSRIVAGAPITGDIYKCQLKPVARAVADGDYGAWEPDAAQMARLETIFTQGVCDWSEPGVGSPEWVAEQSTVPPATAAPTVPDSTVPGSSVPSTAPEATAPPTSTSPTAPNSSVPPTTSGSTVPASTVPSVTPPSVPGTGLPTPTSTTIPSVVLGGDRPGTGHRRPGSRGTREGRGYADRGSSQLPATGSRTGVLVIIGLGLVVVGAGAQLSRRRRIRTR